ncbi:hypothetical protein ABZ499_27440 [Streptomyces sp. NPDC019990]|uniref:hypothetical protein n=1 Tax=Streptomyces sp. NPDC019990 TaxID=3154693 RepID=UPI0033F66D23
MATWTIRPIRLRDEHLPHGLNSGKPTCRPCGTAWPCEHGREYLTGRACTCGQLVWREKTGPRSWHVGPLCYTPADVARWQAADLRAARRPHYPPSHFYPPKPSRPVRQRPPYRHTPAGPGDVKLGTFVWVRPGALHPGWGDIHRLAMVTALGLPKCEIWLHCDGTVHQAPADQLLPDRCGSRGPRPPAWTRWTVAEHLAHAQPAKAAAPEQPVQAELFAVQEEARA